MRKIVIAFSLVTALAAVSPVLGGNCSWLTPPTAVSFGTYSPFAPGDVSTATQFSFRCTPNQYVRITLTPVTIPYRSAGAALYNVYLDAGGTQIWGDGIAGGSTYDTYNSTPQNKDFTDFMYGIAPASQDLAPGTYTAALSAQMSTAASAAGPWSPVGSAQIVTVTLTVVAECRVDTFALAFGNYDPLSASALSQTSTVKVYCTRTTPATASLDLGSNALGAQRRMLGPAAVYLNYNASFTGATSGTSTSSIVPLAGGFPIGGTVPAQQDVPVGSYLDTIQALVNY